MRWLSRIGKVWRRVKFGTAGNIGHTTSHTNPILNFKKYWRIDRSSGRRIALTSVAALFLAACTQGGLSRLPGPGGPVDGAPPPTTVPVAGDVIGAGSVKVALLLPKSAAGNVGNIAGPLRNAAQLAVQDFRTADIQILVKDTKGTPAGATEAAQQAVAEGAELIIGPLLGSSVAAVAPVARGANVPVLAFSTDVAVAGPGVYLLSFLPQNDMKRVIGYATSQGRNSYAALLPENGYGLVVEGAIKESVAANRGNLTSVQRYPGNPAGMAAPVQQTIAAVNGGASALVLPDGAAALGAITPMLQRGGINPQSVKVLGSGQWDNATSQRLPFLAGGWYASPNPAGWTNFRSRYASTFGGQPPRIATLPYDAVSLAAALSRGRPGQRYTSSIITNPSGFAGVDGIFRFRRDGLNERGLAILEVTPGGGARVISPAPTSFGGS